MKTPKSSRDEWKAIVDFAEGAEDDRIAAMTEAEVDAELLREGFDVAALNAKGKAEHDGALRARARARRPEPAKTRRWPRVAALLAAALAVLGAAGEAFWVLSGPELVGAAPDAGAMRRDAGSDGHP